VWLAYSWDDVIHSVGRPLSAGEESGEDNTITVCDRLRTCTIIHTYWRSSGVSMPMSKAGQHTCAYSCRVHDVQRWPDLNLCGLLSCPGQSR